MNHRLTHLFLAGALGVMMVNCTAEPGSGDFVESLRDARPELSETDAECVIAELQRSYTDQELADLLSQRAEEFGTTADSDSAFAARQFDAIRECGLDGQIGPGLVSSFATVNEIDMAVADCAVARLQDQYGFWELTDLLVDEDDSLRFRRRQFEAIFACGERTAVIRQLQPQLIDQGVDPADAECVARSIASEMGVEDLDVLYTATMTDAFSLLYFEALESCGVL